MEYQIDELLTYVDQSMTPYHAAKYSADMLEHAGFIKLDEGEVWALLPHTKYFVMHNSCSLLAFKTGSGEVEKHGFRVIGAHGDAPCFKIKPNAEMLTEKRILKLNTEPYGGPIIPSWFDRPLSLAGRLLLRGEKAFAPREVLIDVQKPVLYIPNLCIHINKKLNSGYEYNAQTDTAPILGFVTEELEKDNYLLKMICESVGCSLDEIVDFDLMLYEHAPSTVVGAKDEFFSAPRLDDLWMCYAGLRAFLDAKDSNYFTVFTMLDNEETGSRSENGAGSSFLRDTLQRAVRSMGKTFEEFIIALRKSVVVSADLAHAFHPNYEKESDPTNRAMMGNGPVIKHAARKNYATNGYTAAIFASVCKAGDVPYQYGAERSDRVSGSTIGPIVAANLCTNVVDVGAPLLSMHSIREFAAVVDNDYIIRAFRAFYEVD